ncbi:SRPBCC family protein [Jiangella rhizosphaerae]|uniref:SRPBCC family protein n=1 Tax=Jiangella rhizosphaerae TaxID=2293569 RepID=UPI0013140C0F|nr:SRPBCC domain-containing protein [Jiangella rhizosphaerae]
MTTPLTLQLKRRVPADRSRVWRAWTDPAELARWYWPDSFDTQCSIDLRVGGRFRIASEPAGMAVSGEFATVEPPARLVHTWRWDGEDDETLVTVEFLDAPDGATDVVVTHERFTDPADSANHAQGWNDCLARLIAHDFSAPDR